MIEASDLTDLCGHGLVFLRGTVSGGASLSLALFVAGVTGSAGHCALMCGPFVVAQTGERLARIPASHLCEHSRLRIGLMLPYHFGRLTTYSALGGLAARAGHPLGRFPWFHTAAALLLLAAAALFLIEALARTGSLLPVRTPWSGWIARGARRIDRSTVRGSYAFGLLLGFLPCAFLYSALVVAASTAQPLLGALLLASFGLGTVPALALVGTVGQAASLRWRRQAGRLIPILLGFNALVLTGIGLARLGV